LVVGGWVCIGLVWYGMGWMDDVEMR
jgi:hypothetical protein